MIGPYCFDPSLSCAVVRGLSFCPAVAQTSTSARPVQRDRVIVSPDARVSKRLQGHVPGWATSASNRGVVQPDTALDVTFVLSRSPELQAQFTQLLADQQDPTSPRYHQWLTPQQVGEQYGPTQNDLDALRQWLDSQGLAVREIAPSGIFVRVSGSASLVGRALDTELHYFDSNGVSRIAAAAEPAIPSAFAPIVNSISGLAEADVRPMHHVGAVPVLATTDADGIHPQYTLGINHFITPGDFATMFDLNSVYSAGLNGAGQKVAVIGRSRVANSDITAFESKMGLSSSLPNVVIPTGSTDPGTTGDGNQAEATLDVERVVGVAPGARVDLVISPSILTAVQYEVQTLLDPVMNISFGACEAYGGASGVATWDALTRRRPVREFRSLSRRRIPGQRRATKPLSLRQAISS